jgi:hypothetical protein
MTCNLQSLLAQACANNFITLAQTDSVATRAIKLQLLCNLGENGYVASGNYGGGQPSFTPSSGGALALDTSNGTLWKWYNNAWH